MPLAKGCPDRALNECDQLFVQPIKEPTECDSGLLPGFNDPNALLCEEID